MSEDHNMSEGVNIPNERYNVQPEIQPNAGMVTKPVVLFFGPRGVGKTVALIRLSLYLNQERVSVDPVKYFRADSSYTEVIKRYEEALENPQFAPERTGNNECMLLNVFNDGHHVCHFLEASGEDFFYHLEPNKQYPHYLNQIFNSEQKKVLIFLFSDEMFPRDINQDIANRRYAQKISDLLNRGGIDPTRDSLIILYNKVDDSRFMHQGNLNVAELQDHFFNSYHVLRGFFGNPNNEYRRVSFVPFSSGIFTDIAAAKYDNWSHSPDRYPKELWATICKYLENNNGNSNVIIKPDNRSVVNNNKDSVSNNENYDYNNRGNRTENPVLLKALPAILILITAAVFVYFAFF